MAYVKIYTKVHCPFCDMAKSLFKSLNCEFEEIVVNGSEDFLMDLAEKYNHYSVPKIFIDDKFIGGYDDLKILRDSGELDKLLK